MGVRKPKVGTVLVNDYGDGAAIVIHRGMPEADISELWARYYGDDIASPPKSWRFDTWRMHSAKQLRDEPHDWDHYWSAEGWCRTSIDVAIPGAPSLPVAADPKNEEQP